MRRWIHWSRRSGKKGRLCSGCAQFESKILSLADEEIPLIGEKILALGKRNQRPKCDMCNFFLELNPQYKENDGLHVRVFNPLNFEDFFPKGRAELHLEDMPPCRFFTVMDIKTKIDLISESIIYRYVDLDWIVRSGVLVYIPNDATRPTSPLVHSVDAKSVDFTLLRSFLDHCRESHTLCTPAESQANVPVLYLIDCEEKKVVQRSPTQIYLALSYVWGADSGTTTIPNHGQQSLTYSFSMDEAPLTIQDAVRAVRQLGWRYLWVDRYCIHQYDEHEKREMLLHMDEIFENAEVTIVAVHGDHNGAGLPGVSVQPRLPQARLPTAHGSIVSSCPPLKRMLEASKWATRGWTYQEGRVSRRCLFFTSSQVYYACHEMSISEAVTSSSRDSWISALLNSSRLDPVLFGSYRRFGFWEDRLVYTRRTLTYESDALDAFRGIMNRSLFITFWGVRIMALDATIDPNFGLSLGLMWVATDTPRMHPGYLGVMEKIHAQVRRPTFPTWSWTSVAGVLHDPEDIQRRVLGLHIRRRRILKQEDISVRLWVRVGSAFVSLQEAVQRLQLRRVTDPRSSLALPEDSRLLRVEGDIVQVDIFWPDLGEPFAHVVGCDDEDLRFKAYFDLKQREMPLGRFDALVLADFIEDIQYKGPCKEFVMMVVRFINGDSGRGSVLPDLTLGYDVEGLDSAERVGLIMNYGPRRRAEALDRVPRVRKRFLLR